MTRPRLFSERARQRRRTGSKAPVPLPRDRCPDCSGPTSTRGITNVPLFTHGGYGAATETRQRWCPCGWMSAIDTAEINPRPFRPTTEETT